MYELKEACIRLAEGKHLYSETQLTNSKVAVAVMAKELASLDRETVCIVNLNNRLQPINYHVVSIGTINQSMVSMSNIFKTAILSNAYAFIILHNHPSGDATPSQADITMTKRCIEAGKLMDIFCLDHIIVEGGSGRTASMREENILSFS